MAEEARRAADEARAGVAVVATVAATAARAGVLADTMNVAMIRARAAAERSVAVEEVMAIRADAWVDANYAVALRSTGVVARTAAAVLAVAKRSEEDARAVVANAAEVQAVRAVARSAAASARAADAVVAAAIRAATVHRKGTANRKKAAIRAAAWSTMAAASWSAKKWATWAEEVAVALVRWPDMGEVANRSDMATAEADRMVTLAEEVAAHYP